MRTLPLTLVLGLLTAAFAATAATAHDEPTEDVAVSYFTVRDGALALSELPPSARNPTQFVMEGVFSPHVGLQLSIPIENSNPDLIVNESRGAIGWIQTSMSMRYTGTTGLLYSPYGSQSWSIVEGARSNLLTVQCRYNDPYYCDRDKVRKVYAAPFPGHEGAGKAHTHGDGTDAARPLYAEDFHWVLTYKVAPCSGVNCPPLLGGTVRYTYSILVDGSTFVELGSLGERDAPPAAEEPADDGNVTAPDDDNATNAPDNSTSSGGNGTASGGNSANVGSGRADSAFQPPVYRAQPAGEAPGASLAALIGGVMGVGLWLRRRNRPPTSG